MAGAVGEEGGGATLGSSGPSSVAGKTGVPEVLLPAKNSAPVCFTARPLWTAD